MGDFLRIEVFWLDMIIVVVNKIGGAIVKVIVK